jgi:hypothetical protein
MTASMTTRLALITFALCFTTTALGAHEKIVAYVPNWVDLESFSKTIDYAKVTHINIAFENPTNDQGDLSFRKKNDILIATAHEHKVKVLVSIGGGSASGNKKLQARYFDLLTEPKRADFAAKLASYVTNHNFDGLDVDIEGPSINKLKRGLPASKTVLGVPFYGYGFGKAFRRSPYSYSAIVAAHPDAARLDQVGDTIWYDGVPTIEAKTMYAIDRKLAGIMIWSLDNDVKGEKSLLDAIVRTYRSRRTQEPPAPAEDRVGFPQNYAKAFEVLRTVERLEKQQVVTVFGNERAASVRRADDLPYPYGSVIVMETAGALKDERGKPRLDNEGHLRKGDVVGLHVMRREKGFGEAYGKNRTGDWEYVEYRPDGTHLTPPNKSFACAECHVKAGRDRDFVYRGRLPENRPK